MKTELTGVFLFSDGSRIPFRAPITDRVEDGCRIYVAHVPDRHPLRFRGAHVDVLPAHSTVELIRDEPQGC